VAVAILGACAADAAAATLRAPWIRTHGTHFVDRHGQRVALRGFNLRGGPVATMPLRRRANLVRVFVDWGSIQPTRTGPWNRRYLKALDREVAFYRKHRVNVLIDFHQVSQSTYFGGNGVPAWYYADGRYPATVDGLFAARAAWWTREAHASHAAFEPFVRMMVRRYRGFANVLGYELWNEPQSSLETVPLHDQTQAVIDWLAPLRRAIRACDPLRTIVFQTRGGADFGLGSVDLAPFGSMKGMALDFHNYYNGLHGSGYTPDGEAWFPDFERSNNQHSTNYHGSVRNQELHFATALRRSHELRIPLLVGEWGARLDDVNRATFNRQMLDLFATHGLSWAEWTIGAPTRFDCC
jgi:hypothetical protein